MIDTFMVLWNRDRKRKGVKLLLTFLLVGISASLLLATLYMPHLISLPQKENFVHTFISKATATASVQQDQAHMSTLTERARALVVTPTSIVETPCVTSAAAEGTAGASTAIRHAAQKKHRNHHGAARLVKKAHQRSAAQSSSQRSAKNPSSLKIIPLPGSTLRPTSSSTGPLLKPTATNTAVTLSVAPVSTATATPSSTATATTTLAIPTATGTVTANAASTTPTATTTVESAATAQQRESVSKVAPLLRRGGGPIFDDASSTTEADASYAAIATNDSGQGWQNVALSCVKKRPSVG